MYDLCDVHDALNSTYENLYLPLKPFSNVDLDGFSIVLALDLHLLEFDPLRATSYIPLPTCIQNRIAVTGCQVVIWGKNEKNDSFLDVFMTLDNKKTMKSRHNRLEFLSSCYL